MGLQGRIIKGFAILSLFFFLFFIPIERIASQEVEQVSWTLWKEREDWRLMGVLTELGIRSQYISEGAVETKR